MINCFYKYSEDICRDKSPVLKQLLYQLNEIFPTNINLKCMLASISNNPIDLYKEILKLDNTHLFATYFLGRCYRKKEMFNEAEEQFNIIMKKKNYEFGEDILIRDYAKNMLYNIQTYKVNNNQI